MRKKANESGAHERAAPSADAKSAHSAHGAHEARAREQSEKEAVARAVLDALRAHDSM